MPLPSGHQQIDPDRRAGDRHVLLEEPREDEKAEHRGPPRLLHEVQREEEQRRHQRPRMVAVAVGLADGQIEEVENREQRREDRAGEALARQPVDRDRPEPEHDRLGAEQDERRRVHQIEADEQQVQWIEVLRQQVDVAGQRGAIEPPLGRVPQGLVEDVDVRALAEGPELASGHGEEQDDPDRGDHVHGARARGQLGGGRAEQTHEGDPAERPLPVREAAQQRQGEEPRHPRTHPPHLDGGRTLRVLCAGNITPGHEQDHEEPEVDVEDPVEHLHRSSGRSDDQPGRTISAAKASSASQS